MFARKATQRETDLMQRVNDEQVKRVDQASLDAKERAELALSSAEKATDKHNELIRKMENERAEFARSSEVGLLRDDVSSLRSNLAKIVGASVAGSVMLAVVVNLLIRLAGAG